MVLALLFTWTIDYSVSESLALLATLFLSTFIVTMLGTVTSVITLGKPNNTLLIPLINLPLSVPCLLISLATVEAASYGADLSHFFLLLLGLCLIASAVALLMTPFALRLAIR